MAILRVETTIKGASTGGDMLSVQHWAGTETADPAEILQQGEEARDRTHNFWGILGGHMHSSVKITVASKVVAVNLTPPQLVPVTPGAQIVGQLATEPLPWSTQGIITLRTGGAVRGANGRIFIPYLTEAASDDGSPSSTILGVFADAADQLSTPQGITALNLVVYHRVTGQAVNVGVAEPRDYWAVLRSRRD